MKLGVELCLVPSEINSSRKCSYSMVLLNRKTYHSEQFNDLIIIQLTLLWGYLYEGANAYHTICIYL